MEPPRIGHYREPPRVSINLDDAGVVKLLHLEFIFVCVCDSPQSSVQSTSTDSEVVHRLLIFPFILTLEFPKEPLSFFLMKNCLLFHAYYLISFVHSCWKYFHSIGNTSFSKTSLLPIYSVFLHQQTLFV